MSLPSTASEVQSAANGLRTYYARMHNEMMELDRVYNLLFVVKAPKKFPTVIPGTGRRQCDRMISHISSGNLRLFCPPRSDGKKWQEIADKKEKWIRVIYNKLPRYAAQRLTTPPVRASVTYAVIRGLGCLKNGLDPDFWMPEPERFESETEDGYEVRLRRWQRIQGSGSPIACVAPDPLILLPDPDGRYVIEDVRIPKDRAERMLGRSIPIGVAASTASNPNPATNLVRWTECWTPERRIVLVNGGEYLNKRNEMGFVPYSWILPGFGEPAPVASYYDALAAGPEVVHRSFLYIVKSMLEEEARRETQIGAIIHGTAWRVWQLLRDKNIPDNEADQNPQVSVAPGDLNEFKGWKLEAIDIGNFPRELFSQISHLSDAIDDNTLPPVARGLRQGENTAYQSQIYLGVARLIMDPLKQATEVALEQTFEHWQMLAEYVEDDVEVAGPYRGGWWKGSLSAEEIGGYYAVQATFDPNLPQDQITRRSEGIKEFQARVIPWEQLQEEFLGNEDASGTLQKVLRDKALFGQVVEQLLSRQAAEDYGWNLEEIMAAEEAKQTERAGGAGPTPEQMAAAGMGGARLAPPGAGIGAPVPPAEGMAPTAGRIRPNPAPAPGSTQEIDLILRQIARRGAPKPARPV
jgi:hypothetical protein